MNRLIYAFFLLALLGACTNREMGIVDPENQHEIASVSFNVNLDKTTRMWYGQDGTNKNKFIPTWNTGDQITLVANSDADIIAPFEITSVAERVIMEGKIHTWSNSANLYAIYPHREDAYSHAGGKFKHDVSTQVINTMIPNDDSHLTTCNSMQNSILLAMATDVTHDKDNGISVDNFYFRQAMSFLRFTLAESDLEHEIRSISLKDDSVTFVTKAKIWQEGNEIKYKNLAYAKEVSATVEGQDLKGKSIINFAVFPTKLDNPILEIQTIGKDNKSYVFTKKLPSGLTFERNIFNFYGSELVLGNDDFEVIVNDAIDVESSGNIITPAGNNWIIASDDVLTDPIKLWTLRETIANSGRKITLRFSDVKTIECDGTFWEWPNLECIELPNCEEIWSGTFGISPHLKKVVMPALKKAGSHIFHPANNLPDVEFIAATNPGVKLEYAFGGNTHVSPNDKYPYMGFTIERVHITLGNQHLYKSNEYGESYFRYKIDNFDKALYFGSMTWL